MAVADPPIARTRRAAEPTWARTAAASAVAVLAGPAAAAAVLLVVWAMLHAIGVTPSKPVGETALLDTLPGSNAAWDLLGSVVFGGLVVLDAVVRVRCLRAIAGVRLGTAWAVFSVLVAPGGWAWLDDRYEALPIIAVSTGVLTLIVRGFAKPSTVWRPTQRVWVGIGVLAVAGLAGLWVAMGAALVLDAGESSEALIAPQGAYATGAPLPYRSLVNGGQKPDIAIFRVAVNNAGLLPIRVKHVTARVSGGLFRPIVTPSRATLDRGDSSTVSARVRIRSCWPLPSGQVSSVNAIVVTYSVLGVERTERIRPDDPLRVVCPVKQA